MSIWCDYDIAKPPKHSTNKPHPLRGILDRSAFHAERFDLLINSRLRELTGRGSVMVFLTPIFLNETLTAYEAPGVRWQEHLAYALDVCNGGIFLDRDDIWREELVMGRGPLARHLLPEKPNKRSDSRPRLMDKLRAVAQTGDLEKEWLESKQARDETYNKSINQRTISKEIRAEIKSKLGAKPTQADLENYPFARFRSTELIRTGRQLMDLVSAYRPARLADQWARAPERAPFYTAFVEGFIYNGYFAAMERGDPDRNAQPDYEQLAYLQWADLVVSNDAKFFTRAFETLWRERGKRLESTEGFVALLERLA